MLPEKYQVKTSVGKFRVEKSNTHLRVGGKRFCVEIKISDTELELQWLTTKDGGCELDDKEINGNSTLHLLNLSFTLLKLYTKLTLVTLLDNSKFDCIFPDESKTTIFMNKYSYLFHGGTWYETKAKAIPLDSIQGDLYNKTKALYADPSIKKPFDFRNSGLQEELEPLYERARTWKEFAHMLHDKYDRTELCRKIAPWYQYAVAILTNHRMLPEYWLINISDVEDVPYKVFVSGGGKTRKYRASNEIYTLSPSELYNKKL